METFKSLSRASELENNPQGNDEDWAAAKTIHCGAIWEGWAAAKTIHFGAILVGLARRKGYASRL